MRKNDMIFGSLWLALGTALAVLGIFEALDEFWSGLGAALLVVGATRLLRSYRLSRNETYREQKEVEATDERMRFIRTKAWSWTGYLFIIISTLAIFLFKFAGQDSLSQAASWAVCLMTVLYWLCYLVLKKKY